MSSKEETIKKWQFLNDGCAIIPRIREKETRDFAAQDNCKLNR
jgi:hypothetical protein